MRGVILLLIAGLLLAGCAQPQDVGNQTGNGTNVTAPVEECSGPVCGADNKTYTSDCEAELAGVSIQYTGDCVVEECSDSDGGINATSAGNATKGAQVLSDYCDTEGKLQEYGCDESGITLTPLDCAQGEECRDAACVPLPRPHPPENVTPPVWG